MTLSDRIVESAPHRWRVLSAGTGPTLLCLHGAGASADSFLPLIDQLSDQFHLVAPDLPGHGATRLGQSHRSGLQTMSDDVATLTTTLNLSPVALIGHSAGAAISLMLETDLTPNGIFLINAALGNFDGLAGHLFPAMARGLAATPFVPDMAAAMMTPTRVRSLIDSTGTPATPDIVDRYSRLVRRPEHVGGALRMMAQWRLDPLNAKLGTIRTTTLLLTGDNDQTVPPSISVRASEQMISAKHVSLPGGHLVHEEDPVGVAELLVKFVADLSSDATGRIYPERSDGD